MLTRLRERLGPPSGRLLLGPGDDAAISRPGGVTATSIDSLVDGIHFRRAWMTPAQVGHKALATALSDLAAMAAEPGEAYVALGVPPEVSEDECLAILDGITALAADTGTQLAGGDVVRSPVLSLSVCVVGHAERAEKLTTRAGAEPGDLIVVTGELGGAAAGLKLLEAGDAAPPGAATRPGRAGPVTPAGTATPAGGSFTGQAGPDPALAALIQRQLEPWPRLEAGLRLAAHGARAMIDLSDGLGADAGHLADAGGIGIEIELARLPLAAGLEGVACAHNSTVWELATAGGEDYELLAALPDDRLAESTAALAAIELPLTPIGRVTGDPAAAVSLILPDDRRFRPGGFDQLA